LLGLASLGAWGWLNAPPVVPPPTLVSVLEFNEAELPPAVRARLKVATAQHQQVEGNDKATLAERGRAWRIWGEEFLIADLWSQGAACLQNAAALRPDEWQDRYLLAMALRQSDDLPAAKTAMESALALMERPPKKDVIDRVNAWCFLASIALKQQNLEEALRPLDKALELDSRCVYALFERGRLHCQNDLLEEALKDLGAANRLYPDSAPIRAALLDVHTKRKNEFAARQFTPRPTTNPRDAIAPESPDRLLARVLADDKPSK
jgi:tetratricopeptide (TPR) repeat protein